MHDVRMGPQWSATIGILVLNVVVFGIQFIASTFIPDFPFDDYFGLSLQGLKSGFVWQLLTYQVMHGGWLHIFLNSWAIFVFGRAVEQAIGKQRMLLLYFVSGVAGGLLQMLCTWLFPGLVEDIPVVGASAGAFGLVAAFAVLFPNELLYMLLFFVIPIKLRAKTLLWISVIIAVIGLIFPYVSRFIPAWPGIHLLFDNIAHAAHLGGILSGYIFARLLTQRFRAAPPSNQFF